MTCPFYHDIISIFVFCYLVWLEVYFLCVSIATPLSFGFHLLRVSSSTCSLWACFFLWSWDESPGGSTWLGLILYSIQTPCVFWFVSSVCLLLEWLLICEDRVLPVYPLCFGCSLSPLCLLHVLLSAIWARWFPMMFPQFLPFYVLYTSFRCMFCVTINFV